MGAAQRNGTLVKTAGDSTVMVTATWMNEPRSNFETEATNAAEFRASFPV
jgi:hypothetical protein